MKKLTLVVLAALLAATTAHAGWLRTYGGSGWDEGRCVQEVEDGYIVTGFTHPDTLTSSALWLLKTDTLGNVIWSKTYGGTSSLGDRGYHVTQTTDGGYIITGRKWNDPYHIWLLKTDSMGDTLWTRTFGESIGYCVQQTQDGGYIVTGRRNWWPSQLFLLKTDSLGDSTWMSTYLLDDWVFSMGYFLQQTEDSGYVIVGAIGDTTFENGRGAFWLIKTNSSGDTQWSHIQGGENWGDADYGRCVRQTDDNGYITLGTIGLVKFDLQGDTSWLEDYQNGSSVDITYDNGYILAGEAGGLSAASLTKAMPEQLWLLKTDNQGDSLWKQNFKDGLSYYLVETADKGFIATGRDLGNGGDLFLLKTDSLGLLGIQENPILDTDNGWNVPYSIGSYVVLHYQGLSQGFRANVFDVSGRQVDQIRGDGNEGAMTWGIDQPPGVYFIQALDNQNHLKTAKVVLVR